MEEKVDKFLAYLEEKLLSVLMGSYFLALMREEE